MTAATLTGLYADPALRPRHLRAERSSIEDGVRNAAEAVARTLSSSLFRLARFSGRGVRTVHAGAAAATVPFILLGKHTARLSAATAEGVRAGIREEAKAYGYLKAAQGAAPAAPLAAPNPYAGIGILGRANAIRSFAEAHTEDMALRAREAIGIDTAPARAKARGSFAAFVAAEQRLADERAASALHAMMTSPAALMATPAGFRSLRTAPIGEHAKADIAAGRMSPAEFRAIRDGAASKAGQIDPALVSRLRRGDAADVASLADRLRKGATGTSLGVMMSLRLLGDSLVEKSRKLQRFLAKGAHTLHVGAYDAVTNPKLRLAGYATALGALAVMGFGGAVGNIADTSAMQALTDAIPNINVAQVTARFAEAGHETLTAVTNVVASPDAAAVAYGDLMAQAGSALGFTDAGADIVREAVSASEPVANAFATSVPYPAPAPNHNTLSTFEGLNLHRMGMADAETAPIEAVASLPAAPAEATPAPAPAAKAAVGEAAAHGVSHKTVVSAADELNKLQLRVLVAREDTPELSTEFTDAVRDVFGGTSWKSAEMAEAVVRDQVGVMTSCAASALPDGACMTQVHAANGAYVNIDAGRQVYAVFDAQGNLVARQVAGGVEYSQAATQVAQAGKAMR